MTPLGDSGGFRGGWRIDMPLLVAVVLVAGAGVINLYSATSVYADGKAELYVSQTYWLTIGFLIAVVFAVVDYRHFERLAYAMYGGGILTLVLVLLVGTGIRGARRWIELGFFSFQPSETMKIVLALALARYLHDDPKTEPRGVIDLVIPTALTALPVGLVMRQPDLGTSLIYCFMYVSVLGLVRIKPWTLAGGIGSGGFLVWFAWTYLMHDYQKNRILSFLDPEADRDLSYHAVQSQTAIGNGGLTGDGYLQGTQNQFGFLPDQYTDFPFAVWAEELGFIACLALLAVYAFISLWSIHIASQAKDRFGAVLAVCMGSIIFWHALANVGMVAGVLPVVGITLPLFSYGGSSVVTMLMALGLLMNVSMRR